MYFRRIIYYLGTTEWLQLSKLEGETQCHALFWNDTYHTVTKWRRIIFFYSNLTPGEHFIGNFEWNRRIIRIIGDWGPLGYLLWVIAWGAGLRKGHCRFYWSFNLEVEDDLKFGGWRWFWDLEVEEDCRLKDDEDNDDTASNDAYLCVFWNFTCARAD